MATTYVRNQTTNEFELVGPGGATTDTTLSQAGKPADAAAVGNALTGYSRLSHEHNTYATQNMVRSLGAYNLLDNSYFVNPVNQREIDSYTTAGYTIDRWKISSGSSVTVNDGSVTVTGNMIQYIDGLQSGKVYTFAYGNGTSTFIGSVAYDNAKAYHYVSLPSGTWQWAALYDGEYTLNSLPLYVPKGYGPEIIECMRYYQKYFSVHFNPNYQYYNNDVKRVNFNSMLLSVPMRTSPNVILKSASMTNVGNKTEDTIVETNAKCITPHVAYDGTITIDKSLAMNFELSADL